MTIIRLATPADAPAISALILQLQPLLTITPDGAGAGQFIASVQPEIIAANIRADNYRYQVALREDRLVGVVAVRDGSHLFNLYVEQACHGQGLGRQLWQAARTAARQDGNPGSFTVNSSVLAEPVYRKWGFVPTQALQEMHGLRFLPMRLDLQPAQV